MLTHLSSVNSSPLYITQQLIITVLGYARLVISYNQ